MITINYFKKLYFSVFNENSYLKQMSTLNENSYTVDTLTLLNLLNTYSLYNTNK